MKQNLPDYIKQNEDLRQFLLSQEGGIMKYLAEHLDADFDADLFEGYEKQIDEDYIRANKQNRAIRSMPQDKLREKSLDWYQRAKGSELKFFVAMKPALNAIDSKLAEEVFNCIDIYMTDAYKECHRRKYPEGMPPLDFYNKVLEIYGPFGIALDCLENVLEEYRGKDVQITAKHFLQTNILHLGESHEWKEINHLQEEFDIRMFKETFLAEDGYRKMRHAVKEMIDNITQDMSQEDCRELCRKLALDNMQSVNQFTRWVNNNTFPMEESEGGKLVPLITPEERKWLRNIMYKNSPSTTGRQKLTTMDSYYCHFIHILQHIGTIWAAQLLVRGIDMKDLEKETGIILSRLPGLMYYVDRFVDDHRGDCLVYDTKEAKELLNKINATESEDEEEDLDEGNGDNEEPHEEEQTNINPVIQLLDTLVKTAVEQHRNSPKYILLPIRAAKDAEILPYVDLKWVNKRYGLNMNKTNWSNWVNKKEANYDPRELNPLVTGFQALKEHKS